MPAGKTSKKGKSASQASGSAASILKLTPWFDAKLHMPEHNGWYDCKECNARHIFKDGLWYRNKKSLKDGPMLIRKMHWRGLARPCMQRLFE